MVGQTVPAGEVEDARREEGGLPSNLAADPWHDIARVPELVPGAEKEVAKVDLVLVYPVKYRTSLRPVLTGQARFITSRVKPVVIQPLASHLLHLRRAPQL
jgi:hypothetical protein